VDVEGAEVQECMAIMTFFAKIWRTGELRTYSSCCRSSERVQKGIAHWDKQKNDMPAPNCMLKVRGEIIKVEGL